jgi:hypothetical protein
MTIWDGPQRATRAKSRTRARSVFLAGLNWVRRVGFDRLDAKRRCGDRFGGAFLVTPTPCPAAGAMERSAAASPPPRTDDDSLAKRRSQGSVRSRGLSPMPTNPCQQGHGRAGARLSAARVPRFVQHFSLHGPRQWCDHRYRRALYFARSSGFSIEPTDSIISASLRLSPQTSRTPDSSLDQGSWLPRGSWSAAAGA